MMQKSLIWTPSRLAAAAAALSTLMLKPMTTAFEALASRMSDSEIGPDGGVNDIEIDLLALDIASAK